MAIRYGAPPPNSPVDVPDLNGAYAPMGLAGLAQGFTHGLEIGQHWGNQADQVATHRDQIAEQSAYRQQQERESAAHHQAEEKNRADMLSFMKSQASRIGTPIMDANGNITGYETGKGDLKLTGHGGKGTDKEKDALQSASAAFMALDNYRDLAGKFMPKDSALKAAASAPLEWVKSKAMQTSPANNLADAAGKTAIYYAAAHNKGGGARMTETEVHNMAKAMGGNGLGETLDNVDAKIEPMKNELAAKLGVSRKQIEDYIKEGGVGKEPAAKASSSSGGEVHVNPQTGEKIRWDGKGWVPA